MIGLQAQAGLLFVEAGSEFTFSGGPKERGLAGVKLVISDAHAGLTKAIGRQLQGSVWQRCRVHFARNLLQCVP